MSNFEGKLTISELFEQLSLSRFISTAGAWGGRNPPQYLASDPAEFYSAKERARKGARGIRPPVQQDFIEVLSSKH